MQLHRAEVQLTPLFISLPQQSGETQDFLQYGKKVCDTVLKAGWSDTAHLGHSGSSPHTHSQRKGLTQHQFGASIRFQRPWIKSKPK